VFDGVPHFLFPERQLQLGKIMLNEVQVIKVNRNIPLFSRAKEFVVELKNCCSFVIVACKNLVL